jgi:asparaginyl-tRNA synthetase
MNELSRKRIKEILEKKEAGKEFLVKGWVRTKRGNKQIAFIALNDGTTIKSLQIVADVPRFDETSCMRRK